MNFNEHISKVLLNEFAGSGKKMTVILDDGCKYLLKMPGRAREARAGGSYINNSVSEYLGCKIMKQLGIPVQEVILGEYTDKRGETRIACACQDVRKTGEQMYEIQKLNLSSPDPEESSIANAMKFADKLERFSNGVVTRNEIVDFYYDMFVGDALIGNTDRSNGNWAVLSGPNGLRISPVYDCGSSLSPSLSDAQLSKDIMEREATTVSSAIIGEDGHRIRYKEYITSRKNEDLNSALKRVVPKINITEICELIDSTPNISDIRKDFYKGLIRVRYERVLLPSLQRLYIRDGMVVNEPTKGFSSNELEQIGASIVSGLSEMPGPGCFCDSVSSTLHPEHKQNCIQEYSNEEVR